MKSLLRRLFLFAANDKRRVYSLETKDYFLGLDLGTGSLGWAVTDQNYEILHKHGKALWGVRLFESANTAEERRIFRTSRRRLDRRNWRIELLQGLFAEEINRKDPGFFLRMKESKYLPEDKRDLSGKCPQLPYALFMDSDFNDKDYHKKFPTIYHLRNWLMTTEETPDIRLVYLAFHHMMKHRGHFLFSGNIENVKEFKFTFSQFLQCISDEELDFHLSISDREMEEIECLLKDDNATKTMKKTQLIKLLQAKTICEKSILNLISGGTVKLSSIWGNEEFDSLERNKISFADNTYADYERSLEADLGERFIIIQKAKAVYDWSVLSDILGEYQSISEAKIAVYEKHQKDLRYLKKLVKDHLGSEFYKEIFVKTAEKTANYSAYIGSTKSNGKKTALDGKQCSKEEFYSFLKNMVLNALEGTDSAEYLKQEMEKGTFLPKQVCKDNGVIPYQIHLYELDRILDNLKYRIPLLAEQGEKIRQIFTFRIPYYVGPLNGIRRNDSTTNWVVRKSHEKIYPWNFEKIIDVEKSAERFIRRMTNKCTYLIHEDVLPKYSLLYSKFIVLNELNNLRFNGEPIPVSLKQKIYNDLFQKCRKVTQKKFKDFLVKEGIIAKEEIEKLDITGIDGDFKGSLTAYHDFKEKLTGCDLRQKDREDIVLNITLFGADKKLLKQRLTKLYPQMTEKQIDGLCSLNYSGWGRLSQTFLEGITAPAPETGEAWTIIRSLWETNDNLMQLLSGKYQFLAAVESENSKDEINGISYELVDRLYVSPAVKRQIWQTLQIVKELCKVMGKPPKRVFVEMAREKAESKRTESRKKVLSDLYKNCMEEERAWIEELTQNLLNTEDVKLRGDRLYLYYTQKGRCMYSGEKIQLQDLWDKNKYDIDHIYPQSKVMDDSLDNRVLVKRVINSDKTDNYPISEDIRKKMSPFWKSLLGGGFISKEKYHRLTRSTEFEPSELAGFIERQLVETRQGTKAVASILKQVLPDTEIVYVKAKTVAAFRQDFKIIKVRELNDLHHAKDAYLNIVVGNVYFVKFTGNVLRYINNNFGRSYNLKKMFTSCHDISANGETAWKAGENGTIATIKKTINKNNILVTRRAYEAKGGLFKQQILKKGKGQVSIKSGDARLSGKSGIEKYGGYDSATGTYFMLVESEDRKGRKIRSIEFVPLYLCNQIETDKNEMKNYLMKERQLINPDILLPKIKIDTLFKVDGFYMWLSGRSGKQLIFKGANQLILSPEDTVTLKKILKFVKRQKENKNLKIDSYDELTSENLIKLYDTFLDKLQNSIYYVRLSEQEKTLQNKRDVFCALSSESKCVVLSEILHMFQCQSGSANLKLIDGPSSAGILHINNVITKYSQISIINQSPTGIYEQEIDLRKL